ncbi:MAG: molybdopterin-dependent oxidoreductase [Chloroflexi bacterium]|nr:molybdopterin-dependent oxidoreductase [Chloroflexota bacterium]
MPDYSVIGKPVPRVDARVKVTGQAVYAADISLPGQLYGALLRAPYAHARILNIDTSRAEKLPGVRGVVTGKDFPQTKFGFLPQTRDRVAWPRDKVRHYGEAVAAVAAIDEDIAEEALDLIRVEYEELPAVLTAEQALRPGAPVIHDHAKDNVAYRHSFHHGNVDRAFAESDIVKEAVIRSQRVTCGFIEPHAILAHVDASGTVVLQGSLQSPYIVWRHFCRGMDLPLGKVRIINPYIGGGFSGKQDPFDLDFAAAGLAMKTGRPVKIVMSQEEVLATQRQRHAKEARIKMGAKKDGTLTAVDCRLVAEGGAYACVSPLNMQIFGESGLIFPYRIPNVRYEGIRVYTNRAPCGAVRGQSLVIARYVAESILTMLCEDLGMDQFEIRLKNAYRNGDVTPHGMHVENLDLVGALERVAKDIGWYERKKSPIPNRGIGFGAIGLGTGLARISGYTASAAVVKVTEDATVNVIYGGTEIGQGIDTVAAQVAAEVLGVPVDDVTVDEEDTNYSILEAGMYASRGTVHVSGSIKAAAEDARRQIAEVAAQKLEVPVEDIELRDRRVFSRSHPQRSATLLDIVRESYYGQAKPIYGRGSWTPPYLEFPGIKGAQLVGHPFEYAAIVQAIEAEVDPETGKVKVIKSALADELGQPINPMLLAGQMEGGTLASMGQTLFEDCEIDGKGKPLNADFLNYKMCTSMDAPEQVTQHVICPSAHTTFGAKGGGEISTNTSLPAAVNAVCAATGVRFTDLPITPQKIVAAWKGKKKNTKDG